MKDIGNWSIEEFNAVKTYGGLLEGDPRSSFAKECCLSGSHKYANRWLDEKDRHLINFYNEEEENGCLKRYILTFVLIDYSEEVQAVFVVLANDFNNVEETIKSILEQYPDFKKVKFDW